MFKKEITTKTAFSIIILISFLVFLGATYYARMDDFEIPYDLNVGTSKDGEEKFEKFKSEDHFKAYLELVPQEYSQGGFGRGGEIAVDMAMPPTMSQDKAMESSSQPDRVSGTNVQVAGIDEPDIVKTDGNSIYFSPETFYYLRGEPMPMMPMEDNFARGILPPQRVNGTLSIKAFPPGDMKKLAELEVSGNLLLSDKILVVFSGNEIIGYDISKPESPKESWKLQLKDNSYLMESRLHDGKIYLISRQYIDYGSPCPVEPFSKSVNSLIIPCQDIYYPVRPIFTDSTFVAMVLNPQDGKVEKSLSFIGSSGFSVIYMSENSLYATYSYQESVVAFWNKFFKEEASDLVPASFTSRLDKLATYDISESSKLNEFNFIFSQHLNSLSNDERLRVQNELGNRASGYYKKNVRALERSGIVRIEIPNLSVKSVGSIPGNPLNQFSLDEYEGNLRIATTIGNNWGFGMLGLYNIQSESANDIYVLGPDLKVRGSVEGLGLTERIYSARFVQDKGYIVTFRQVDPFYVLDLSNPDKPQMKGELKIPGFSSYLHPINKDTIVGVGQEGSQVKVSLFDVSSPTNPREADKYMLSEYWTEVSNNHHAFLMDQKHEIFFLPGGQGGYVFSYKDNKLSLVKAVSDILAKRAIFINDYLYIVGEDKIVVLNENDWQKLNELELR